MSNNSSSSGIGFFGLLTILFIGLKFTGHIEWSWFWGLSPIILPSCLMLSVIIAVIIIAKVR